MNETPVRYDSIRCPVCGNIGCSIKNATAPTVYHCPCGHDWNPDNLPPKKVGDLLTVQDLRPGDDVRYAPTENNPEPCSPYSTFRVGKVDAKGVTMYRAYITTLKQTINTADLDVGLEEQWFDWKTTMRFVLAASRT
jgi:hypothetical protein